MGLHGAQAYKKGTGNLFVALVQEDVVYNFLLLGREFLQQVITVGFEPFLSVDQKVQVSQKGKDQYQKCHPYPSGYFGFVETGQILVRANFGFLFLGKTGIGIGLF